MDKKEWNKMICAMAKSGIKFIRRKFPLVGCPAIIKNKEGEILLAKRSKKMMCYPSYWGLPGGVVEWKESFEDGVKREIKEEIGVKIKIIKRAKKVYEKFPNKNCPIHCITIPFNCKIIRGIPKPKDETSEVKWFKKSEIKAMKLAYDHKKILKEEGII